MPEYVLNGIKINNVRIVFMCIDPVHNLALSFMFSLTFYKYIFTNPDVITNKYKVQLNILFDEHEDGNISL